jgi:hypothetical protein
VLSPAEINPNLNMDECKKELGKSLFPMRKRDFYGNITY